MIPADLYPDLGEALEQLVPVADDRPGDWDDVVGRLGRVEAGGKRGAAARRPRIVLLVAAAILLVSGIATATYFALRPSSTPNRGGLTIVADGAPILDSYQRIVQLGRDGVLRTVWECPGRVFCGEIVSLDWSPDGTRLAIALDEVAGRSPYPSLHVIDVTRGKDTRIPPLPQDATVTDASITSKQALGCFSAYDLDWSPDGHRLAYVCPRAGLQPPGRIYLIGADGSRRTLLKAAGSDAASPSWSPDGRIAFELRTDGVSSIYIADTVGSRRRLFVARGRHPAWSPDGTMIAFSSSGVFCAGTRVLTVSLRDAGRSVVGCGVIGPAGTPEWSPDGKKIAIATRTGVYVVGRDGSDLHRVTTQSGAGPFGAARPSWAPTVPPTGATTRDMPPPACTVSNCP